jgi:hypothetical protein
MEAVNAPVRRAKPEVSNADFPIGQKPPVNLDDGPKEQIISALDSPLGDDYAQALAFAEEPIEILIHPSREPNAPIVYDVWVNGKGAEVFVAGKWHVFNCLPVGKNVITKRKYVEVLARSKVDNIATDVDDATMENPGNRINRVTSSTAVFSVIGDNNPRGREWLRNLMAQQS